MQRHTKDTAPLSGQHKNQSLVRYDRTLFLRFHRFNPLFTIHLHTYVYVYTHLANLLLREGAGVEVVHS